MSTRRKNIRKVDTDVIVVGGGTAGLVAGLAAAQNGVDAIIIEKHGFLGGMAASGLAWAAFLDENGNQVVKGIPQQIIDRLMQLGGSPGHLVHYLVLSRTPVNKELVKIVASRMAQEVGLHLLLHSLVVETKTSQNGRIEEVIVHNSSGKQSIRGKIFIDATGDAEVAAAAGVPYEKSKSLMPPSLLFELGNVNVDKLLDYLENHPEELEAETETYKTYTHGYKVVDYVKRSYRKFGCFTVSAFRNLIKRVERETKYVHPKGYLVLEKIPISDHILDVSTRVFVDATDAEDLARAEIEAHEQMLRVVDIYTKYIPGFEEAYIASVAPELAIRETRRIIGEYILNESDVLNGREFDDGIGKASHPLDVHAVTANGKDDRLERLKKPVDIPYRCLIPKKMDNILVAGRCVSVTREALGTVRAMPACMAMGQAAGMAAALAVKKGISPKKINTEDLRKLLREQGAIV